MRAVPKLLQGPRANDQLRAVLSQRHVIGNLTAGPLNRALAYPFIIASDASKTDSIDNVVVTMHSGAHVGYAEGAHFFGISGDTQAKLFADIEATREHLVGKPFNVLELEAALRAHMEFPAARAAIEIAFFDLIANAAGLSLAELLNPHLHRRPYTTDITIPIVANARGAAGMALTSWQMGFDRMKIKVGDHVDASFDRVKAIHGAIPNGADGRRLELLIDANEGFQPNEAIALVRRLWQANIPIAIFEQPIARADIVGLRQIRDSINPMGVLLCADESVYTLEDARMVLGSGAVDMINLKTMKHGGLIEAIRIAELAHARGVRLMIGGMVESGLAMQASLELANALGMVYWFDLDTPLFLRSEADDPLEQLVLYQRDQITSGPPYHSLIHQGSGRASKSV